MCCMQLKLWPFLWVFSSIFAKIWLPWQPPSDPCSQKCLLWIGQPRKLPVISNHIRAISSRNALYAFITILDPKLVAMVTPLYLLCTGVSHMYSLIAQTLSQNQTLHGCVAYNWSYGNFCDFLVHFGQDLVAMVGHWPIFYLFSISAFPTKIPPYSRKCS